MILITILFQFVALGVILIAIINAKSYTAAIIACILCSISFILCVLLGYIFSSICELSCAILWYIMANGRKKEEEYFKY